MRQEMISRLGQAMPSFHVGANVAGEGVRERLRSTTFALFGLVTAIGLVLVGISYNQGWPDFVDSPIPGIPTERVGEATIAAPAADRKAHSGNVPTSPGAAPAGQAGVVPGRSPGPDVSAQQQLPVTAPDGQVPGQAPSGQGVAGAPGSPAPAPAPPAADQPSAAGSPALAPRPADTPVATSPPASQPAATGPGNGKAKGHEKSEKSEKSHGKSSAPAPVVPTAPSVPPAPTAPAPEAPAGEGPGNGKGNAKGHYK
jgi:hypothetical protein